jgi:hypothetical protein
MIISSLGSLILALLPPPSSSATTATLLAHALLSQPTTSSSFYMLAAAPSFPSSSAKAVQARQVLLFSVANTLARLVGGFLADYLSAPLNTVVVLPSRLQHSGRRRWLGRGLTNVGLLPILTISVGLSYGLVFTLAPALIAQVFGLQTFGRCVRPRPLTPFLPTLP